MQECTKLFLVKLPEGRKFMVPKNLKLIAVPLCQIHENDKVPSSMNFVQAQYVSIANLTFL